MGAEKAIAIGKAKIPVNPKIPKATPVAIPAITTNMPKKLLVQKIYKIYGSRLLQKNNPPFINPTRAETKFGIPILSPRPIPTTPVHPRIPKHKPATAKIVGPIINFINGILVDS